MLYLYDNQHHQTNSSAANINKRITNKKMKDTVNRGNDTRNKSSNPNYETLTKLL